MPVALLNEIVLALVGAIVGYKLGRKSEKIQSWFNRTFRRGAQDV